MRIFKLFLASPSDTSEQRNAVKEVIEETNRVLGTKDGFLLQLLNWEDTVYSSAGIDGQDVINKQIGNDYDIFIGIMWKKFGSPTKRADSGTEEEFSIAYERFKDKGNLQIMFFFNSSRLPQDLDLIQFQKVKDFKSKIESLGILHKSFETADDFKKLIRCDLISYIKDVLKTTDFQPEPNENFTIPDLSENFKFYLNSMEVKFAHSKVDSLCLEDIYIAPDLKDLKNENKNKNLEKSINIDNLTDSIDVNGIKLLLVGNSVSGKTAASKYLFNKYFVLGFYPVFLTGNDFGSNIRLEAIIQDIEKKIAEQYTFNFRLSSVSKEKIVLIIDDFHKSTKGIGKFWYKLINNLEQICPNIIITGNTMITFDNFYKKKPFVNFEIFLILEFGPKYRNKLVDKWNTIGIDARFIDRNEILRKNDSCNTHIKSIIGKNYIPSYPFYLLSILQTLESGSVLNPNYSIHGFYYEVLINDCLAKAITNKKEIGLYYNFLTQFCFLLFDLKVKEISIAEFKEFYELFCAKHDITYNIMTIINTLDKSGLLNFNGKVYISEKYVYYFFVAKYISNEIGNKQEVRDVVSKMCQRVFRDEYASILMFVTHLSKDGFIISELVSNANLLFNSFDPTRLQEDVNHINELVKTLPTQVIEMVNVDAQREEQLEDEEEIEKIEKELEDEHTINYEDLSLDDDISTIDVIADVTRALKTIDILGQVAKKNWGELEGDQKLILVNSTYNLGLRTLSFYLQFLQKNTSEITEYITQLIEKKHFRDRFSLKQGVEEEVKNFIFRLCFISSYSVIKRVSNSIGYDALRNTFAKVLTTEPHYSVKLIDLAIKLGFSSISSHLNHIEEYQKEMVDNKISTMVLQNIVIDYLYMYDTDYKLKTRICNQLGIGVKDQFNIEKVSKLKKR